MKRPIKNQDGNVLFYILIAVALVGALSYVMTRGSGDSTTGMLASKISEEIKSQAQNIRSAIMECNLVYGNGYPPEPSSPYTIDLVMCTTDTVGPVTQAVFGGASGRFVPPPPAPFTTGWTYRIDTATTPDSIYIELTDAMDCTANQGLISALNILETQFAATEAVTTCNGTTASFRLNIVLGS